MYNWQYLTLCLSNCVNLGFIVFKMYLNSFSLGVFILHDQDNLIAFSLIDIAMGNIVRTFTNRLVFMPILTYYLIMHYSKQVSVITSIKHSYNVNIVIIYVIIITFTKWCAIDLNINKKNCYFAAYLKSPTKSFFQKKQQDHSITWEVYPI